MAKELKELGNWTKAHLKSEIRRFKLHRLNRGLSSVMGPCRCVFNLKFLISDLKVVFCPISQFPYWADDLEYIDAKNFYTKSVDFSRLARRKDKEAKQSCSTFY